MDLTKIQIGMENFNFHNPGFSAFPSWVDINDEKPWLTGDGPSKPKSNISYFPKELFEWEDE